MCMYVMYKIYFTFRSPRALSTELYSRFYAVELYSRLSLVVYFIHSINSVYMSVPISQFISAITILF